MSKKYFLKAFLLAILFLNVDSIFAQGPPPPPPPLPIDGGIFGLFAVAVLYAVKKIRDSRK